MATKSQSVSEKKEIHSNLSQNGFPQPKKAQCFQCQQSFYIKFVIPRQEYSQKNSWDYWTGERSKESTPNFLKKEKKICNSCLKKLYYDKPVYWKTITDLRKRSLLKSYIHDGHLA